LKILHICQYYNDGYGYQENLLPRYQQKLGHEVFVVSSDRTSASQNFRKVITGMSEDFGVPVIRLPILGQFKGRFVFFKGLKKILEKEKPNYIFHHGLLSPSLITCAKYKRGNPTIFLAADNHSDYHNSGKFIFYKRIYYKFFWKFILRKYYQYIDKFYSITENCMFFGENELRIPQEKHFLLHLGADVETNFFSPEWRCRIREEYGFSNADFVVITAGKIKTGKKTESLVKAIKDLKEKGVKLLIVGSITKRYETLLDRIIDGDNRIRKTGWVEAKELYKFFSAADVAIFPGSQSAIWQQAVSCELPLIIKYTPESEYLLSQENGLFLFSDEYKEISQSIQLCLNYPAILEQMKKKSRVLKENFLSYEKIAEATLSDTQKDKIQPLNLSLLQPTELKREVESIPPDF